MCNFVFLTSRKSHVDGPKGNHLLASATKSALYFFLMSLRGCVSLSAECDRRGVCLLLDLVMAFFFLRLACKAAVREAI